MAPWAMAAEEAPARTVGAAAVATAARAAREGSPGLPMGLGTWEAGEAWRCATPRCQAAQFGGGGGAGAGSSQGRERPGSLRRSGRRHHLSSAPGTFRAARAVWRANGRVRGERAQAKGREEAARAATSRCAPRTGSTARASRPKAATAATTRPAWSPTGRRAAARAGWWSCKGRRSRARLRRWPGVGGLTSWAPMAATTTAPCPVHGASAGEPGHDDRR